MGTPVTVADIAPAVRSARSLLGAGWSERAIDREARGGVLHRVRRGWYMDAAQWRELWPEGRHLAHSIAVARDSTASVPLSHTSAAVVWGLPLYRVRPARVHQTCGSPTRVSSGADVHRHIAPLPGDDIVIHYGLRITSLSRTVVDNIRLLPPEAAVALADAAERMMAQVGRQWNEDAVVAWRRGIARRIEAMAGARGIRQARWVSAFADGRAQLPGESVSRLQLVRIGFAVPDLQVPVRGPDGRWYYVDFGLRDVRAWGEFDGHGKYTDDDLRDGRSPAQVMLDEKRREDWIRGTSQMRMARWEDEHIASPARLAARLDSFGIRPFV